MDLGGVALFVMAYLIGMRWDPALVRGDGTDQLLTRVGWVAGIGLLGIILCLGAAIRWRRRLGRLYERRVPARWRASSLGLGVVRFAESFHALRSGRALGAGLGWTAAIWVIITGSLWTFLQAYGIPLSFYSTLVILGAATLGVAFPTPGGVGGVQLTLSFTLVQLFGVATETADAAAVGFQALVLVPSILIGLPFLWREGLGWWTAGSRLPEVVT